MKAKVSVIVPVYNVEKYLAKCLDSLVNQTMPIEIIVINDSSLDSSQSIIDSYASKYPNIKSYVKENGGIADVRNYGLDKVETEYFGFLDSDDYAKLDMYEKLYHKAIEEDADIVVSNFYWVNNDKITIGLDGDYQTKKEMLVKLMATLWNKLYKTSTIKNSKLRFPTGYRYEDAYFLYAITPYINKISYVNEAFVYYVQREGSITHTHNDKVKDMVYVFESLLRHYQDNDLYNEYYDELEYLFTKFFLGNSFLRTVQIKDPKIRNETLALSFQILEDNFSKYYNNKYLNSLPGLKNKYFKIVRKWNYKLFAYIFRILKGVI